jgi:hypothetical protein
VVWTLVGIAGIWVAVTLISLLSPDMVTGSEQQHLPVAAFGAWLWGLAATGAFVWGMGRLRGNAARQPFWVGLAVATIAIWGVATVLSIALPVYVTGSDPPSHRRHGVARGRGPPHHAGRHRGRGLVQTAGARLRTVAARFGLAPLGPARGWPEQPPAPWRSSSGGAVDAWAVESPAPGPGGEVGHHREAEDPADHQPQGDHHHPQDLHRRTSSPGQGSIS